MRPGFRDGAHLLSRPVTGPRSHRLTGADAHGSALRLLWEILPAKTAKAGAGAAAGKAARQQGAGAARALEDGGRDGEEEEEGAPLKLASQEAEAFIDHILQKLQAQGVGAVSTSGFAKLDAAIQQYRRLDSQHAEILSRAEALRIKAAEAKAAVPELGRGTKIADVKAALSAFHRLQKQMEAAVADADAKGEEAEEAITIARLSHRHRRHRCYRRHRRYRHE